MSKHRKIDSSEFYSIVRFKEEDLKLFEAIPDSWFVDNDKTSCYWPPKGKSFKLRALSKAKPESSWIISPCIFVGGGYVTYNAAFLAAKDKIEEQNTTSADDHLIAKNFHRKHPVLALSAKKSFENIFAESKIETSKNKEGETGQPKEDNRKTLLLTQAQSSNRKNALKENRNEVEVSTKPSIGSLNEEVQSKCVQRKQVKPDCRHLEGSGHESLANSPSQHRSRSTLRRTQQSIDSTKSSAGSIHGSERARSSSGSGSRQSSLSSDRSIRSISKSGSRRRKTLLLTQTKSSNRKQNVVEENSNEVEASAKSSINPLDRGVQSKCVPRKQTKHDSCHLEGSDHESLANSPSPHPSRSTLRRTQQSIDSATSSSRSIHGSARARSSSGSRSRQSSSSSGRSIRSISKSGSRRSDSQSSGSSCSESDLTTDGSRSNSKPSSRNRFKSLSSLRRGKRKSYQNSTENRSNSTNKKSNANCSDPVSLDALDRRITRMEVTINKIFVMVGDIIKHSNKNMRSRNENRATLAQIEKRIPNGFTEPDLPIGNVKSLYVLNKMLKKKDIYSFMLEQEKEYCAPSKSSNNVVMTAYLKRFISLEVRREVALKDPKGQKDLILYRDFKKVYGFLVDVMKSGYLAYNEQIKSTEVKTVLRTVWGRTNQLLGEETRRKYK